ncbi:amidohydrolase family protein [Streptomyces sp. NPDC087856]|uniref:amidohydrolase family protein n=1 Tax=Streptomyces sp. NPDC087856 TaxID=3365811 RepID=UPI00380D9B30
MGKIDTHHHFVAPTYRRYLADVGYFGGQPTPAWSPEASLQLMDELGISFSVLSTARPGFYFGDQAAAAAMAREVNEYAAGLARERPDRFGFFAALPLPGIDDALEELAYAVDVLKCDGVVLLANQEGTYLGDAELNPVMEECHRRSLVVFVHPNALPAASPVPGVPPFVVDFLLDTTRAALNLVRHGCLQRYSSAKFLLAHGGGFLPYAAHRIAHMTPPVTPDAPATPEEFLAACRSFYFDTALTASPSSLPSLLNFAAPGHITYGSDFPYAPVGLPAFFTDQLNNENEVVSDVLPGIENQTAFELLPRLKEFA